MSYPSPSRLLDALAALSLVSRQEGCWYIYSQVFPMRNRVWRSLRILLGGDPFEAELAFAFALANARTTRDVEDAFYAHRVNPDRLGGVGGFLLGTDPNRKRVYRLFHHVMREAARQASAPG